MSQHSKDFATTDTDIPNATQANREWVVDPDRAMKGPPSASFKFNNTTGIQITVYKRPPSGSDRFVDKSPTITDTEYAWVPTNGVFDLPANWKLVFVFGQLAGKTVEGTVFWLEA